MALYFLFKPIESPLFPAGAYLSAAYALRYPERVAKLVLLSPAGVPADPNAIHDTTMPSRELFDGQPSPSSLGTMPASTANVKEMRKEQARLKVSYHLKPN